MTASKAQTSFAQEIASIQVSLSQPETEESWDAIAQSILDLEHVCETFACNSSAEIVSSVRALYRPLTSAMNSERTRLSGTAINFFAVLAAALGRSFEPLVPLFFPPLLALCARTNKVFITRARTCILTIVETTHSPSLLPFLLQSLRNKTVSLRLTAMECILACLNCFNPPDLEKETRAQDIENAIRITVRDANPEVRRLSRKVFEAYKVLLPARVDKFITPLSPTMKKYLDVSFKPSTSSVVVPPKRPQTSLGHRLKTTSQSTRLTSSTSMINSDTSVITLSRTDHPINGSSGAMSAKAAGTKPLLNQTPREHSTTTTHTQVPSSTVVQVQASRQESVPSTASSAARKRTLSAPARPTFFDKSRGVAGPIDVQQSTLVRPTPCNGSDDARRHQPSALSASASVSQTHLLKLSSTSAQAPDHGKDNDALMKTARRVPITDAGARNDDGNTIKQLARPNSYIGKPNNPTTSAKTATSGASLVGEKGKKFPDSAREPKRMPQKTSFQSLPRTIKPVQPLVIGAKSRSGDRSQGKEMASSTVAQLSRTKAKLVAQPAKPVWGRAVTRKPTSAQSRPNKAPLRMSKDASKTVASIGPSHGMSSSAEPYQAQRCTLPPAPLLEHQIEEIKPFLQPESAGCQSSDLCDANQSFGRSTPVEDEIKATHSPESSAPVAILAAPDVVDSQTSPERMAASAYTLDPSTHTPITSLLTSIQRGFLPTPSTPLSPPQGYLGYTYTEAGTMFGVRPLVAETAKSSLTEGRHKSHTETAECQSNVGADLPRSTAESGGKVLRDVKINT